VEEEIGFNQPAAPKEHGIFPAHRKVGIALGVDGRTKFIGSKRRLLPVKRIRCVEKVGVDTRIEGVASVGIRNMVEAVTQRY
jgi:hypothetical protein